MSFLPTPPANAGACLDDAGLPVGPRRGCDALTRVQRGFRAIEAMSRSQRRHSIARLKTVLAAAAHHLRIEHHAINASAGLRVIGPWHINKVNGYHGRLKNWLRRFDGVAPSNLPHYLGWFRALERFRPTHLTPTALPALAIGIRGHHHSTRIEPKKGHLGALSDAIAAAPRTPPPRGDWAAGIRAARLPA